MSSFPKNLFKKRSGPESETLLFIFIERLKFLKKSSLNLLECTKELEKKIKDWEQRDQAVYNMQLRRVREMVKETSLNLSILKGVRLLTLSSLEQKVSRDRLIGLLTEEKESKKAGSCLPDEVACDIFRKAQKAFIDTLLENWRDILSRTFDSRLTEKYQPPIILEYFFKMLDFLVQNEFISQERYMSMFQDSKILDEVV